MMDASKLRDVCNTYTAKDYYVEPIPGLKASNARTNLKIRSSELIVALVDFTIFGGAEEAMVLTDEGLCWKSKTDTAPQRLSWAQLRQRTISEKKTFLSKAIDFGGGLEMELSGAASLVEKDNHLVLNLLNELKALPEMAGTNSENGTPTESSSIGLIECEFCKGKIKPEVTYCKHCGIKLRG